MLWTLGIYITENIPQLHHRQSVTTASICGAPSSEHLISFALMSVSSFQSSDNQDGSDWRDEDEKLPGHENLTEKDIELFRHIQELALQVHTKRRSQYNFRAHRVRVDFYFSMAKAASHQRQGCKIQSCRMSACLWSGGVNEL